MFDVYIASPLFSSAERSFNEDIAGLIRARGYSAFLPQELPDNHSVAPTEREIFEADTNRLLQSRVLLAVIDGEATDAGVALEIGIALAHHIPVVGLWTDIRQRRTGSGRMYRNIYLTGAIRQNGAIVDSIDAAVASCGTYLKESPTNYALEAERVIESFRSRAPVLKRASQIVKRGYEKPFDSDAFLARLVCRSLHNQSPRILDFGAGTGRVGKLILKQTPEAHYYPWDPATKKALQIRGKPKFDAIILSFVLHDYVDKGGLLADIRSRLNSTGKVILLDLEASDLPRLCRSLEDAVLRFRATRSDSRLTVGSLAVAARNAGLAISEAGIYTSRFGFGDVKELATYIHAYSLDRGFDIGLMRHYNGNIGEAIARVTSKLEYPFVDTRSFLYAVLEHAECG